MAGSRGQRLWGLLALVAAALLILGVAATAGRPTVFTDTDDYYALGKELATDVGLVAPPDWSAADLAQAKIDAHMGHTQMASRSAVYAVFLYALESAGTLWLVAAAQAVAVAWPVMLLWRAALPGSPRGAPLIAIGIVAIVAPLPFFVGFAMPDIFAGVAVIAAALLLIYPDRLRPGERWGVAALLVVAMAVHTSHILVMVPLLGVAGLVLLLLRVDRRRLARRLGAVAATIAVAVAANSAYGVAIRLTTGEPLRNQPFLTARLLADGPGRAYLRHACATGERYALCAFAAKPLADSEDILWSDLPGTGVFMLSDYATRVRLEDEEGRFVLGTIAYAPAAQLAASLHNWGRQLAMVFVDDPVRDPAFYLTDPYWRATNLPAMIARVEECGPRHTGCRSRLTVPASRGWHGGAALVAAVAVAALLARRVRRAGPGGDRLTATVVLLIAGVVLNAGVCGVLSGPFARYQARIVWLVPLAAGLLVADAAWLRRNGGGTLPAA